MHMQVNDIFSWDQELVEKSLAETRLGAQNPPQKAQWPSLTPPPLARGKGRAAKPNTARIEKWHH